MSRVSEELGASERVQPLLQLDLAHYTLQPVRADAEFELFRGHHSDPGEASRSTLLVRTPVADPPSTASLRRMQEEYSLRSELDPAYVVRPLALIQAGGPPMLV